MTSLVKEIKANAVCDLFWDEKQIEDELSRPIELTYEPVGELGVYSKDFVFSLPYKGNDDRCKDLIAVLEMKITSDQKDYKAEPGEFDDNCYYNVKINIMNNKEKILSTKYQLFSTAEPEYWGRESAIKMILT